MPRAKKNNFNKGARTANAPKIGKQQPTGQPTLDGYLAARTASTLAASRGGERPTYQPTIIEQMRAVINLGQSCYMSVILVLCMFAVRNFVPPIPQFEDHEAATCALTDAEPATGFAQFIQQHLEATRLQEAYLAVKGLLSCESGDAARKQALRSLRSGFTTTGQQECAQEFLRYLAAGSPLFRHHVSTTLTCDGCGEERLSFDQGIGLALEPQPGESLPECIARWARGANIDDRICTCGATGARKTDTIELAPYVALFLKQQPSTRALCFPTKLSSTDLRPLTKAPVDAKTLVGVVYYKPYAGQHGHSGHYTVAIPSDDSSCYVVYNDDRQLRVIAFDELCTSEAYILVYGPTAAPTVAPTAAAAASSSASAALGPSAPAGSVPPLPSPPLPCQSSLTHARTCVCGSNRCDAAEAATARATSLTTRGPVPVSPPSWGPAVCRFGLI